MDTQEIMKIAKPMAIEILERTEGPYDARLVLFTINDLMRGAEEKNVKLILKTKKRQQKLMKTKEVKG